MLIAVLESGHSPIERDVEFALGAFTAEGLGELSIEDLRDLDAARQLRWTSQDMRLLALGYSVDAAPQGPAADCTAETQLRLAVDTEVVYVPPHRVGSRTEAELKRIVADMNERGWILVEDTRVGAAGGHLTFQRAEPIDPEVLAALSCAG